MTEIIDPIFKKFNIDPGKIKMDSSLKPLPIDWFNDIIEMSIDLIKSPSFESKNINKVNRQITLIFENDKILEEFENQLNTMIPKMVNEFIRQKGEEPKSYNRILVTQTTSENGILTISY